MLRSLGGTNIRSHVKFSPHIMRWWHHILIWTKLVGAGFGKWKSYFQQRVVGEELSTIACEKLWFFLPIQINTTRFWYPHKSRCIHQRGKVQILIEGEGTNPQRFKYRICTHLPQKTLKQSLIEILRLFQNI